MELLSVFEPTIVFMTTMWQLLLLVGIVAIVNIIINRFESNQKIVWILVCLFVPFGGLIYFAIGRKQRMKI